MCGLPLAVGKEEGAREVQGWGRLGVPLYIELRTVQKVEKHPKSYFCRLEGTHYSY
jgi:hypothetical protein